jgi:hypothetical protein
MELSRAVATGALILAALLVIGHARGDDESAPPARETLQKKIEKREAARRAAMLEQQRRAEIFDRQCRKPVKTSEEMDTCRAVYRQM